MAASKKRIKSRNIPGNKNIEVKVNPDNIYSDKPSWRFNYSDKEKWCFNKECIGDMFWDEIHAFLQKTETRTWGEILVSSKKQNHSLPIEDLSKSAQDRLADMFVEAESIISLRTTSTHRLYGYMSGSVFHILWYDCDHGDNETCVCRSYKKHT